MYSLLTFHKQEKMEMSEVLYMMNSQKNVGLLGVEEIMAFLTLLLTLLEYITFKNHNIT